MLIAARYGYASLVKPLLSNDNTGLILDILNDNGSISPLSCAAKNGHTETVKILLEYIGMNPMVDKNESFETPLCLAAAKGYKIIVHLFIERDNLDLAIKGVSGQALSAAAKNGHAEVVKLFLEKDVLDLNWEDSADHSNGRTALSYAASRGYTDVVRLFLEKDSVDLNAMDK